MASHARWISRAEIGGVATLLGAASAAGSLVIARAAKKHAVLQAYEEVPHATLTPDGAQVARE